MTTIARKHKRKRKHTSKKHNYKIKVHQLFNKQKKYLKKYNISKIIFNPKSKHNKSKRNKSKRHKKRKKSVTISNEANIFEFSKGSLPGDIKKSMPISKKTKI